MLRILIRYHIISIYLYQLTPDVEAVCCPAKWYIRGISVTDHLLHTNLNTNLIFGDICIKFNARRIRALNTKQEPFHSMFVKFPNIHWSDSVLSVLAHCASLRNRGTSFPIKNTLCLVIEEPYFRPSHHLTERNAMLHCLPSEISQAWRLD